MCWLPAFSPRGRNNRPCVHTVCLAGERLCPVVPDSARASLRVLHLRDSPQGLGLLGAPHRDGVFLLLRHCSLENRYTPWPLNCSTSLSSEIKRKKAEVVTFNGSCIRYPVVLCTVKGGLPGAWEVHRTVVPEQGEVRTRWRGEASSEELSQIARGPE